MSDFPCRAPITVLLLNYNGGDFLNRCVQSLAAQKVLPASLILIDNGSAGFDESAVRDLFGPAYNGTLTFLRLPKNFGYAKGMNAGLEMVLSAPKPTEWVMTLNNDTEFPADFFAKLNDEFRSVDSGIGMLGPKIKAMHARDVLDGTGIGVCLDGMSTARGQRETDRFQYDSERHILVPNGVAAVYRVSMLRDVGLMDEDFWSYCEDTDLGLRAWMAGWECRFLPECVLYHARSASFGEFSLKKLYLVERNHFWVAVKNMPLPFLLFNPVFTAYRYLLQAYAIMASRGQGRVYGSEYKAMDLMLATLKGVIHALGGLPHALSKRRELSRIRRRTGMKAIRVLWKMRLRFTELLLK